MTVQTNSLSIVAALVLTLAFTALALSPAGAQDNAAPSRARDVPPGGSEPDAWPGYAVTDEDAARQGRAALPFTQDQIETLGRLLRQTQEATARGAGEPAQGRIRRVRIAAPGGGAIPGIELRRGYTTAVSFTGATGAPWPIAEALVDRRFLPPGEAAGPGDGGSDAPRTASGHLLYLAPRAAWLSGNAVVKLAGLAEPVVLNLRGTGADADFHVEIRLGVPGPNADPGALARPEGFHAGDAVLLGLLGGAVPPDAERLAVAGGDAGDRAWRRGGDLLLVTRAHLLSPGPWAAERDPGGRWAYRLTDTPHALVSAGGLARRLSFGVPEYTASWPEEGNDD